MSQESWLFLFALCGALGGIAAFGDLIWKLMRTNAAGPLQMSRSRGWFTGLLLVVSLALSVAGFWTIYHRNEQQMAPRTIEWGVLTNTATHKAAGCEVQVDTSAIASLADKYYVVLVCGVTDAAVDPLQDTRIAVSAPFTISGGIQGIADMFQNQELLQIAQQHANIWQKVILVPQGLDVTEIKRLSDVPKLGGKLFQ
jgi:hypothetical protein